MANDELVNVDRAFQNAWIVYLNGIEVPAVDVTISYGVWQMPEAQVSLVPDVALNRLGAEDRLTVQVFYCDHWQNPAKPEFRLIFDGEIVGWSYVNTARGRRLTFSCVDYSQIFTQLFFFFMSTLRDIGGAAADQSIGVNIAAVETPGFAPLYPYSLFAKGLIPPSLGTNADGTERPGNSAEIITRPIDYLYNVILGLTSADVAHKGVPASTFFAPWAYRTNFNRRFIALPYMETSAADPEAKGVFPILRAVKAGYAISAVSKMASDVGSSGSIWQVLQTVYKTVMMEIVMLPTPAAYTSTLPELTIQGPAQPQRVNETRKQTVLGNYFVKPNLFFGLPPACNVFFPSMISSLQYREDYSTQPTRTYVSDETMLDFLADPGADAALVNYVRAKTSTAHPEEVYRMMKEQQQSKSTEVPNHKNMLVYPEEFFKGPVVDRRTMPRWFYFLAQAQYQQLEGEDLSKREGVGNEDTALYRKYAAYEFFKERYSRRTGAVSMAFNPYPVPGFPCAVFDRRSTRVDVFGYVTNVTQSLSTRSCSTQLGFSYGRTIQEVFKLLVRQFVAEKAMVDETWQKNRSGVFNIDYAALRENAELVGTIATAPAEPIIEIRDIIQNPENAEKFYRSLFFRDAAPEANVTDDSSALDRTAETAEQEALDPEAEGIKAVTTGRESKKFSEAKTAARVEAAYQRELASRVTQDLSNRKASFFYGDHVDIEGPTGNTEGIKIVGIDAPTRLLLLDTVIPGIRGLGTTVITQEHRDLLAAATNTDVALLNEIDPFSEQGITENQTSLLNNLAFTVTTASTEHNLKSDITLVPKAKSQDLFESYEAAMRFVARPICTLDEYVDFLGVRGTRQGTVEANATEGANGGRVFPARYHARIRQYRQGPPPLLEKEDYGNSKVQGFPDGVTTRDLPEIPPVSADTDAVIPNLPSDFPENREAWDTVILAYRLNALERLAPRT